MVRAVVPGFVTVAVLAVSSGCYDDGHPQAGQCDATDEDGIESVPNEGWTHVNSEDQLVYEHNPPASGPHFPVWAGWGVHDDVVNRGNWVHNLEHGGIVLLIGDGATDAQVKLMHDAFDAIPDDPECHHPRAVLTKDPKLDVPLAVVAAVVVLEKDLSVDRIKQFALACRNHAPEDICY